MEPYMGVVQMPVFAFVAALVAAALAQLRRWLLCRPDGPGDVFSPLASLGPSPPAYALLREKNRVSESVVVRVRT